MTSSQMCRYHDIINHILYLSYSLHTINSSTLHYMIPQIQFNKNTLLKYHKIS